MSILPSPSPQQQTQLAAATRPVIIAHRGCSAIAPENTLAAYRAAIEAGAPAAECDVRCTSDAQVILLHDATLDRTTDGQGKVTDLTLPEVQRVDAGFSRSDDYRGEPIPTLREALALIRGKLRLVVEIKAEGIVSLVTEVIRQADALADATIICFDLDTCAQVRHAEPRLPVGWLTPGLEADDVGEADELIHTALSANVQFINVAAGGVRPSLIERASLAGLSVWAWTVNDPDAVRRLTRMGVRGITTDDPAMALNADPGT